MATGTDFGTSDFLLSNEVLDPSVFSQVLHGFIRQKENRHAKGPWDRKIIPPGRSPFVPPGETPPPKWQIPFQPFPPALGRLPAPGAPSAEESDRYVDEQMIRMSLCELFRLIDQKHANLYDTFGLESLLPAVFQTNSIGESELQKEKYQWSDSQDGFPPHCKPGTIPEDDSHTIFEIFNTPALLKIQAIISGLTGFFRMPSSTEGMAGLQNFNQEQQDRWIQINSPYKAENVGSRKKGRTRLNDWFSDSVFGQQQFAGTNATTITKVPQDLLNEFQKSAQDQNNQGMTKMLSEKSDSIYAQDCRYFREAIGADPDAEISVTDTTGEKNTRWACATVSLFHLEPNGRLHPIAICIDYRGTMQDSVVIFNKNLTASTDGKLLPGEGTDWPWRYAKNCAQVTDWIRHEIAVHLTDTHFIEEAIIVASHRVFNNDHIIQTILQSHWFRTLSLNASARSVLVPEVVIKLVGFTTEQSMKFIRYHYNNFDWCGRYIPNDLANRGFPPEQLPSQSGADPMKNKFHNYSYARNILPLWQVLQTFVRSSLADKYPDDAAVTADKDIQEWCDEIRNQGGISKFPSSINTVNDLVDAITMCIHIASPQHTAVNYLQQYYMTFVPNKPAALCTAPPKTKTELMEYTEGDLMASLPVKRAQEWLLASHVPWLLSFQAESKHTLLTYAHSQGVCGDTETIRKAARKFYKELQLFEGVIDWVNSTVDDKVFSYDVLRPEVTAVSILI